jgi:hypothetical protein
MYRTDLLAALAAWAMRTRARPQPDSARADSSPAGSVPFDPELVDVDHAVGALTHLIETTRQQAIAEGVRPIPAAVYRSLLGYFPPILLRKTRFAGDRADALASPALVFPVGDAAAVTLGEIVLFKTERLAQSDLKLWAHELTHVMQYQRWGIDGFADHCLQNCSAVRQEASDNADRFMAWLSRHGD